MDAWLHTECGLDNMTRAQYTPQEIHRLQLGYLIREQQASGQRSSGATGQRRSIRQGQRQARSEMLEDLGFE